MFDYMIIYNTFIYNASEHKKGTISIKYSTFSFSLIMKLLPYIIKRLAYFSALMFIVLTPLLVIFYSEPVALFIETRFKGIDFNALTMDRYRRTLMVSNNIDKIKYGLGSTTEYITKFLPASEAIANRNLHCDLLRLYFECGYFGMVIFIFSYFKTCVYDINALLVIFISFLDLIFNHTLLGGGNAGLWALIYLLVYKFNYMLDR